jgi:hypothetical protein
MLKSNGTIRLAALAHGTAALIWCVCCLPPITAVGAEPRIEIESAKAGTAADAPTIPWVLPGDNRWRDGQPLFEVKEANDPAMWAKGWMAVTSDNVLIRVVVHHTAHLSSSGGPQLFSGDSIQFGIDPLGRGAAQPALANVQEEVDKKFGKSPADKPTKDIQNFRDSLEKQNRTITEGNLIDMLTEDQDFCVGTVGQNASPSVYTYYSGHGNVGEVKDVDAKVARDEAAQLTTYDIAIPWSEFGLMPGLAPTMKVAFQINNTKGKLGDQTRLYWGGGVGGRFAPWKFQTVMLGETPAGTHISSLVLVKQYVSAADDYVEAMAAVCGAAGTLSAQLGAVTKSLDIPAKSALQRYSVRAYPGALRGSTSFKAGLVNADTETATEVATHVFDDSSSNWYVFAPKSDTEPSVIGMQDWMDAPAGKHGFVQVKGKDMVFEDGTPVKFWGVGSASYASGLAPDKETAKAFAAWYEKWGVNSIRNGVFFGASWMGLGDANDSTKLDPVQLDRFDFSFSELKAKGVYYNIVAFWTDPLRPGDKDKVLAFEEVQKKASELETFAEDIQDLRIAAFVEFLKHKNPYTGLTYAEDPALPCLEIRNEQDIYWYTIEPAIMSCPTYLAKIRKQFCDWLRARYANQEKLAAAWGSRCMGVMMNCPKDESLEKDTLHPISNAWFYSQDGLASQEAQFGARRRLLDTAEFLFDTQNKYYARITKAIRDTGYKGILVGSNWQAGDGVSHLYNLLSDRSVGRIDRHNYFGGADSHGMTVGTVEDNSSMLWQPGRALLSSGLQQMEDRPFALTEWMEQAPNEWAAEGSPTIGFYGFGLQGWDAAYAGNNTAPKFDSVYGTWLHVQTPVDIGLYPAIARSVFRGDVKEGGVIASRRFSLDDLQKGSLNFSDVVVQNGDEKTISSTVPVEALAAGRVVLEQVDKATPSLIPDMTQPIREKVIVSNTGQLEWHYPSHAESYFTVNTDGTKGLVGFAPDKEFTLGDVRLQVENKFAVLLVTALDKGKTLADTRSALITAIARERNTGMVYNETRSLTALGTAPILLEPIFGSVTFGRKVSKVNLLDHDGKRTDRMGKIEGGKVTVDGVNDKTMYYEVVFE